MEWSRVGIHGINQAISALKCLIYGMKNENIEFFECFDNGQMNFSCENKIVNVKQQKIIWKNHMYECSINIIIKKV